MILAYITIFLLGLYGGFVISLIFDLGKDTMKKTDNDSATITYTIINPDGTETSIKGANLTITTTKPKKDNGPT